MHEQFQRKFIMATNRQIINFVVLCTSLLGFHPFLALGVTFSQTPLNIFFPPSPSLLFSLSVEFPTAGTSTYKASTSDLQTSYNGYSAPGVDVMVNALTAFKPAQVYDGYFDSNKCYNYISNGTGNTLTDEYFIPTGYAPDSSKNYSCANSWNGNFLNWLTTSSLDIYRKYLTGGARDVDSAKSTRLVRSWLDGRASELNFPDVWLDSSVVSQYTAITPANKPYIIARASPSFWGQGGLASGNAESFWGCRFYCNPEPYGDRMRIIDPSNSSESSGFKWDTMPRDRFPRISVVACDSRFALESNCSPYYNDGSTQYYKPIGLIQQYQNQVYFGAFSYVNVDSPSHHAGGVMRSPLKAVDGSLPGSNAEIDPATGVFIYDPENLAGGSSNVVVQPIGMPNSGLINYINQFGSIPGSSGWRYVQGDVTGELLYETLRYLSLPYTTYGNGIGSATPEYMADLKTGQPFESITTDGFPIFSSYSDPLVNSCQSNNIVFIGDVNQNCDGRIPGGVYSPTADTAPSAGGGTCLKFTPSNPIPGLDVSVWVHEIEKAEGGLYSDLVNSSILSCPVGESGGTSDLSSRGCWNDITPNLPALAFWAHVNDIRSDLQGMQTVNFYSIDVHEQLTPGRTQNDPSLPFGKDPTPYWLAAKYGGFTFDGTTINPNLNTSSWSSNNNGVPNNFLVADTAFNIQQGFKKMFSNLNKPVIKQSNNKIAVGVQNTLKNTKIYKTYYGNFNGNIWQGNIVKSVPTVSFDSNGTASYSTGSYMDFNQAAAGWLKDDNVNGNSRQIITASRLVAGGNLKGVPFQWNSLSPYTQKMLMNTGDTIDFGTKRLNYLRGNRLLETASSSPNGFRKRSETVLGDIINSSPVFVGASQSGFSDSDFPVGVSSYNSFSQSIASRRAMVYVGANDGMLHGFDANTLQEIFSFIPSSIFKKLKDLSSHAYKHEYFVDETPLVVEVPESNAWTTQLIGFPGMGGTGLFALDITSPDGLRTNTNLSQAESNAGNIFRWELNSDTDADVGNILNRGQVNRARQLSDQVGIMSNGRWAVIVGNGYNAPNNSTGLVIVYLDSDGGVPSYKKVMIPGVTGGLSTPTAIDIDFDGKIDYAYAGDLQGNLWRFDLRGPEMNWSAFKLFQALSPDTGKGIFPQSIVTGPALINHCFAGFGLTVIVGTGKYFEPSDSDALFKSTIYGLRDDLSKTNISRNDLVEQTFIFNGVFYTSNNSVGENQKGWFMDSWDRILFPPYIENGMVYFNTMKFENASCGNSTIWPIMFSLNACTGQRPSRGVFDINNDGMVDSNDQIYSSNDDTFVYASGVAADSLSHLFDSSNWIDPKSFQCTAGDCSKLSVALSNTVGVNLLYFPFKRVSWVELKGK
jgi:type IV pilus assembly protein PilY1